MDLVLAILDALESPVRNCGSSLPGDPELDRLPGDIDGPRARGVGLKWVAVKHMKPYRVQTQVDVNPRTRDREVGMQM
ncbi:hypothetical protein DUI87_34313 [Hirundo rustica rustica]|uniref:Uncharacterized protein n=1 Tax=Hirundo rustica rustica TaxID=333673 RepID=A0A3M0ILT1_HIRRU|nr:hypothetical protein DUI87_34313 [Hirundo rustica rustica]